MQNLIDNQYLLHHLLPRDKNKRESFLSFFFSSTLGDNYSFNSNIITTQKSHNYVYPVIYLMN
jgi:hypothetical protein